MSHDHATAPPAPPAEPDPRLIDDALWYLCAVKGYIDEPPFDEAAWPRPRLHSPPGYPGSRS